jgi:hypothetical protein
MPTVWQDTYRRLWSCCAYAIAGDNSSPIVPPQHATVSETLIDAGLGGLPCFNPWMLNTCCSLPKRPGTRASAPICCRHLVYGKRRDNAIASEEETTGWTRDGVCFSAHEILLIAYLNPIERRGPTRSSAEILNRIN